MYTTLPLRNILVSVSKNQRKKSRPNKKWVDMQYLITFARTCFSVGKRTTDRKDFLSKSEMFYFRDRSIKKSYYFGGRNSMNNIPVLLWSKCCHFHCELRSEKTIGSHHGLVRTRPSYGFFSCRPRWHFMMNFAWKRLVGISQNIGNAARVQLESQSMRWFFYANRHQSVAFQPLRLLYYLTKNQSSKYFEIIV